MSRTEESKSAGISLLMLEPVVRDMRCIAAIAGLANTEGFGLADAELEQELKDWCVRQAWETADRLFDEWERELKKGAVK